MRLDEVRELSLFDGLSDAQLDELVAAGEERTFEPGQEVFREGRTADVWWVLLAGSLRLIRHVGNEETVLGAMTTPGQWAGGFHAWDPNGVYFATGVAAEPSRVLAVPTEALRDFADAWFAFGVHFIRGLVDTVRRIESQARQREALVALGTLAAGLAHEINNPASAATRAVDALEETSAALLTSLGNLAGQGISAEQFMALDALRGQIRPQGRLDSLALADLEDELSVWLIHHGVQRDWIVAPAFAAAGVDVSWCDQAAELFEEAALGPALEWVANSLAMPALLSEVKDSTRRISDLVAAVRSYSQLDRAAVQQIDVTEGIESTLVMLGHKLTPGVTVERDYAADVPQIQAVPGELNQVWTNIIDNALDAMDGGGRLRISTRLDPLGQVVIEIADDGPGMPTEVAARAFEPFYTTKDVGRGTGLGLDISRRIVVERHSGEIVIESTPTGTTLRVRLPVKSSIES